MAHVLQLPDQQTRADLATFVARARRVDPQGVARLVGHGQVLAVYVSPVHGGGGPTVLGLRTLRLPAASRVDVTVTLACLADQLPGDAAGASADPVSLESSAASAGGQWAGISPPRQGWQPLGTVPAELLAERASAGIAEVVAGAPDGSGASAVAALRARVWGRPLLPDQLDLPAGVAFAVRALGFLDLDDPAVLFRCGSWWRLSSGRGHVLARRPALL